ncbi:MAG TPA: thiamine pyrophosphate-dependent enzyme, partial [Kiloniellaceae bacterium]|nr:thiamine pyrophosphate-dependent enzyme [Kiloniellaceae bacterium]
MDAAETVHENFLRRSAAGDFPAAARRTTLAEAGLTAAQLVEIFESQALSRQLDLVSRKLQARGEGFYTIGSSGHEGSAAVAAAFRLDDLAFLHYREAAFLLQRSKQLPGQTPIWDMLLSFVASAEDPISGGRHKVLGSKPLFVPPQTSTIASHLPKAVGAAYSVGLARRLGAAAELPGDAVVLCSFGDASANHSTSQGAFNSAAWTAYQGVPLPLVFVCHDNGLGISVKTPDGWIETVFRNRPGLTYFSCDGLNVLETYREARRVAAFTRKQRKPAFLHMSCVRLFGHAGPDHQESYLTKAEIARQEDNDPLLHSGRLLVEEAGLRCDQVRDIYLEIGARVTRAAEEAIARPKLATAEQVMASLLPPKRQAPQSNGPAPERRSEVFGSDAAILDNPQHMARLINWALTDLLLDHSEIVMAGEDIGKKGGVYGVTTKLQARFGPHRIVDSLLDEQAILGLAIGLAHNGVLPIVEIQFLAYLHNAEDQLRGEAATLSFFSNGQYTNPMVVRIAGLGYQKGFGGHFHNDNSIAVLRDIPGLVLACPSNGADAVAMLRECVRLAREEQRVAVFLEPIALYMTRDLHAEKDGGWTFPYAAPGEGPEIRLGDIGQHGDGADLAIVSYANGHYLSRQAAEILEQKH